MELFNSTQVCEALDTSSVNSSVMGHVHDFQIALERNPEFAPEKKQITSSSDRHYNLAVSAFTILKGE